MADSNSSGWNRVALIGLGALAIVLSILVLVHPGMTVVSIVYLAGIVLIIVGIEVSTVSFSGLLAARWDRKYLCGPTQTAKTSSGRVGQCLVIFIERLAVWLSVCRD